MEGERQRKPAQALSRAPWVAGSLGPPDTDASAGAFEENNDKSGIVAPFLHQTAVTNQSSRESSEIKPRELSVLLAAQPQTAPKQGKPVRVWSSGQPEQQRGLLRGCIQCDPATPPVINKI